MTRHFLWAFANLAILVSSSSQLLAEERAPVRIPEMSRRQLPEPFCVVNVKLTEFDSARRKTQLLAFMRRSFIATDLWMHDFMPLNIDYKEFLSLDLIFFRHCTKLQSADVYKTLSECPDDPTDCLGPETIRATIDGTTPALGEPSISTGSERDLIDRYIGVDRLVQCSIKVPLRNTPNLIEAMLVNGDIRKLQLKYILPIMMTTFRDDDVYIILSRNCENAPQLYNLINELLQLEGPESLAAMTPPIFNPDMSEYLRSISKN